MNTILRSFGLAFRDIFHPWVIWLTLRPFVIAAFVWFGILWLIWTPILDFMRGLITSSFASAWIEKMMTVVGFDSVRAIIAPYFSVVLIMPFMIVSILLLVSFTSITAVMRHLEKQKSYLEIKKENGGSFLGSLWVALSSSVIFLILVTVTLPVWWIPPIFAVIPPILWGWLTTRLMTYDVLARHASKDERLELEELHRWPLLIIGVIAGLLGAAPTLFWLSSVFVLVLFPFVSMLMMWVYSLVFIFAALWFAHYLLFALKSYRELKGEGI
jgi:hypothetical protein